MYVLSCIECVLNHLLARRVSLYDNPVLEWAVPTVGYVQCWCDNAGLVWL